MSIPTKPPLEALVESFRHPQQVVRDALIAEAKRLIYHVSQPTQEHMFRIMGGSLDHQSEENLRNIISICQGSILNGIRKSS